MIDRYVLDNKVAVLISSDNGAGWSTWTDQYQHTILFDPWIVDVLLSDRYDQSEKIKRIIAHCNLKYPGMYLGGISDLEVVWVPKGTQFRVVEYDGQETLEYKDQVRWITA